MQTHFVNLLRPLLRKFYKDSVSGTVLGSTLIFLNPVIIVFCLSLLLKSGFRGLISGDEVFVMTFILSFWLFFSATINQAGGAFSTYRFALYTRSIPRYLLTLVPHLGCLPILVVNILITLAFYFLGSDPRNLNVPLLMFSVLCCFSISMLLSVFVGYVSAVLNDFKFIVGSMMQLAFWMSPIFWDSTQLGTDVVLILSLNPFFVIANLMRLALTGSETGLVQLLPSIVHIGFYALLAAFFHKKLSPIVSEQV